MKCLILHLTLALVAAGSLLAAELPDLTVRLVSPLELADFTVVGAITPAGAQRLMKEKIKLGSPEADAYEFLLVPADPKSKDPKAAEQRICKRRSKSAAGGARKVRHLPGRRERFLSFEVKSGELAAR